MIFCDIDDDDDDSDEDSDADTTLSITMAPNKQPSKTAASAVASGNTVLTDYFKRIRRGRPKKSGNMASDDIVVSKTMRRGPVPGSKKRKPSPPHSTKNLANAQVQPPEKRVVKRRTNCGEGEAKINMEKAVSEWDGKTGRALDSNVSESLSGCRNLGQ